MNMSAVHRRLKELDLRSKCPPSIFVLTRLYGLSHADIAREIRRSPNMVTYYVTGHTPLPPIIHQRLRNMLTRARDAAIKADFENDAPEALKTAIIEITSHVLNNYARLHK